MLTYKKIQTCRISGEKNLISVLNLGYQALTGVFPSTKKEPITVAPLELVWCPSSGLLQLNHSCDFTEMYGDNYGYRSGLNQSMVEHLTQKVHDLEQLIQLKSGDIVLDIGSNDCTMLNAYSSPDIQRIGIDPTGKKFSAYYPKNVKLVPEFFSKDAYLSITNKPATIITSIAMFYDLENPVQFAREIESILSNHGIWHFEQSYMPAMLRLNAYDTICHEHLEYYSLSVVKKILDAAGLKLVNVIINNINGGSFGVTVTKTDNHSIKPNLPLINSILEQEARMELSTIKPYRTFKNRVFSHRNKLKQFIQSLIADNKKIIGYGASTKGNVLLQLCGFTTAEIPFIAEINEEKVGKLTPGTHIPIISEKEAKKMKPDYFIVLPWHFRRGILLREQEYLKNGGNFIFPFPTIEIV